MRTQTKIRNKKIVNWMFEFLFFGSVSLMLTLCVQKFNADNARAQASRSAYQEAPPIHGPSILQEFMKQNSEVNL